jgi:hypothetical protein
MNRSFGLTLLFLGLISATALGDSLYLVPNCCGDNFGYRTTSEGHPLVLSGGTDPYFFSAFGYQPGATAGGGGALFLYSAVIWIDGTPLEFSFDSGQISMTSFNLPTDGRSSFTAFVEIFFFASGINYDTGQTITVDGGAVGKIPFYLGDDGLYYAGDFAQAPEPGTLALFGTGLMGILASVRKRLKISSARR